MMHKLWLFIQMKYINGQQNFGPIIIHVIIDNTNVMFFFWRPCCDNIFIWIGNVEYLIGTHIHSPWSFQESVLKYGSRVEYILNYAKLLIC